VEPEHSQGRVHIVDDDASLRVAMGRRLTQAGYMVTTYATAQHLLDNLPTGDEPGCIILDVRMPGLAGPALQKRLGELGSTMPIIFLTAYADTRIVVQTLKAGALDFLAKPVASDDLLHAVEKALRHHQALRDQQGPLDGIRARLAKLTPRERQVFDLIIRGNTNKAIGLALDCTERTVKAHRHRVMEKMQVQSLAELVSLAVRVGRSGGR
jgi:FixJ family two-component response regulator